MEAVLLTYKAIKMITLTIDPDLFFNSKEAFFYVTENRCLRKLIHQVMRKSSMHTDRYFWVIEFTQIGAPHVHIALDASYVPADRVQEAWDRFRPEDAGAPEMGRPEFGATHVRGSPPGDTHEQAAARMATYLTDTDAFIPEWVMKLGASRRIRTFGTSWRFWPVKLPVARRRSFGPRRPRGAPRSYEDRAKACGSTSNMFVIHQVLDKSTGELKEVRRFIAEVQADLRFGEPAEPQTESSASPLQLHAQTPEQAIDEFGRTVGQSTPIIRLAKRGRAA